MRPRATECDRVRPSATKYDRAVTALVHFPAATTWPFRIILMAFELPHKVLELIDGRLLIKALVRC